MVEFSVKSGQPEKQRSACLIFGLFQGKKLTPSLKLLDKASGGYISALLRKGDITGQAQQYLLLHDIPNCLCDRIMIIGCGKERDLTEISFKKIASFATNVLKKTGATEAVNYLTELPLKAQTIDWKVRQLIEATEESLYTFEKLKSEKPSPKRSLKKMVLDVPSRRDLAKSEKALKHAVAIAQGVAKAKDLGNLPGNICTPSYLAKEAQNLGRKYSKLKVKALSEDTLKRMGMGAFYSVSKGSEEPGKLITMQYQGTSANKKPIIFVGKGITFDSGGISIKPGATMDEMKYDMCGAASVFGVMLAVCELKLPLNVIGIVAAAENMPDGRANKPGDIVTSLSGQTIEVLNTDAEGRLVLCDALTYCERYNPDTVIDVATLTGACVVALGKHATGLFSNHNPLANEILHAGNDSVDRLWHMPMWDDYQNQLDSNFADMANIGGQQAGSVTAACFLSRFAKQYHWAHLDIAGTAWLSGAQKGATGRPVPALVQFLLNRCKK